MKISASQIALVLSLGGCLYLSYLVIDRSISLSYSNQSNETTTRTACQLSSLLTSTWKGLPRDVVFQKLQMEAEQKRGNDVVLKKEKDTIWFDQTAFHFENGRLKKIGEDCVNN